MVCDRVDLKWVTLCLSRQPKGRGYNRRSGEKLLPASKLPKEMGTAKKSLGLWWIMISFQNLLRGSYKS